MLEELLNYLKKQSWNVELKEEKDIHILDVIGKRYKNIPQQWLNFVSRFKSIVNRDNTTWFLCEDDFCLQEENKFRWNEWEIISLESVGNDSELENEIREFWNKYLPIIMSVRSGYSYYAISMENGSIVYGIEPEFEECEIIADSFEEFIRKIMKREIII